MAGGGFVRAILAVALVAGVAPAARATPPPDRITEDTTWAAGDSPFFLGSLYVEPGVTLTIEPGVQVLPSPGAILMVGGALRAEGTAADPIVFGDGTRWDGIRFLDAEDVWPPSETSSAVRHVHVDSASVGIRMEAGGAVPVHDSRFTRNDVALEVLNPATTVTFTGNELYSNRVAFTGKTTGLVGIYRNDFWDNDVNLFFEAQDPFSCARDHGVFDVHHNDILRGPDNEWYSFDVRTSNESIETNMRVVASENWWGTTDEFDIEGRMDPEGCCATATRTRVLWRDPATGPQTEAEPPGPAGNPPEGDDVIVDIEHYADLTFPDWGDCLQPGSVRRIEGVARPAIGEVPEEMETIALVRGLRRCKSYDPARGFVGTPCDQPIEFSAPVRRNDTFVVRLRRPLRPGRYKLYAGFFGRDRSHFRVLRD